MNRLAAVVLAAALAAPAPALAKTADAERFGPLLSADELAAAIETRDPLLIDIRGADADGASLFEQGHVPGSVNAPYGLFRGPSEDPGRLVAEAALQETLRSVGVELDRPTVIVYQGASATDFGAAARVYWTLKSSGVEDLAILNGGVEYWTAAGYEFETGPSAPTPSAVVIDFSDEWLATREDVLAASTGRSQALLLDARPEAFYLGDRAHPAAAAPGTLPNSEQFVHAAWLGDTPAMGSFEDVMALAEASGFTGGGEIISFCNTGHWAATNWFALSEVAGAPGVKLYPESMVGYTNAGLPAALGPSPASDGACRTC